MPHSLLSLPPSQHLPFCLQYFPSHSEVTCVFSSSPPLSLKASCFLLSWAHFWFPDFHWHLKSTYGRGKKLLCFWILVTSLDRIISSSTHVPEISVISYSFIVQFLIGIKLSNTFEMPGLAWRTLSHVWGCVSILLFMIASAILRKR